ncbi:hypothetical protein KJM90_001248 [Neisseria gonorrhoeae]
MLHGPRQTWEFLSSAASKINLFLISASLTGSYASEPQAYGVQNSDKTDNVNRLTRPLAFSVMRNFPLSSVKVIMIIYYITLHRNEKSGKTKNPSAVIPAKAGIQNFNASRIYRGWPGFKGLGSRLRGNDGLEITRNEKKNRNRTSRIPARAGMTISVISIRHIVFSLA